MSVYIISGLSGVGKTTISEKFVELHPQYKNIDQDKFYIKQKPKKIINDKEFNNWDCIESIDWQSLNKTVIQTSFKNPVILSGFALWTEMLRFPVKAHIHLEYGDNIIEKCIKNRSYTKSTNKKDNLIVEKMVYPFYLETLKNIDITHKIPVYCEQKRIPINEIIKQIEEIII